MTKTARKPRSDSVSNAIRIMQGAKREIAPPTHIPLQDIDWPFWESVVAEFARADWTEHALELAAMLARTMAEAEENQRLMREEGVIIERDTLNKEGQVIRTVTIENPRARVCQSLMGQILALRRSLALHAKAKSGSNADAGKQRGANKRTEQAAANEDDGLLS